MLKRFFILTMLSLTLFSCGLAEDLSLENDIIEISKDEFKAVITELWNKKESDLHKLVKDKISREDLIFILSGLNDKKDSDLYKLQKSVVISIFLGVCSGSFVSWFLQVHRDGDQYRLYSAELDKCVGAFAGSLFALLVYSLRS